MSDDVKMGVINDYAIDQHLIALNGLAVMLQMVDRRGYVTAAMAKHAAGMLAELSEWLRGNPGIDLRLPIDEVATLTREALKRRLEGLQSSRPVQTTAFEERALTSEQQVHHKWGQSGPRGNGDRVDLSGVMEAMGSLASLVIELQKSVDRVWLEVRRA